MYKAEQPLVSIIVPVYNVGNLISRCIESILYQSFTNFELILIDDGSTDNSMTICNEYIKIDKRIKYFYKENGGATSARKYGVQKSQGLWITFVDSDDTLPKNAIELLYNIAKDHNYDIVGGTVMRNNKEIYHYEAQGEMNSCQYIKYLLLGHTNGGPVAKLIKGSLLKSIQWNIPKEITNNEDLLMLISLAQLANRVYFSDNLVVYNYICRAGSVSSKIMNPSNWILLFEIIKDILKKDYANHEEMQLAFSEFVINRLFRTCIANGIYIESKKLPNSIICDIDRYSRASIIKRFKYKVINYTSLQPVVYSFYSILKFTRNLSKMFY